MVTGNCFSPFHKFSSDGQWKWWGKKVRKAFVWNIFLNPQWNGCLAKNCKHVKLSKCFPLAHIHFNLFHCPVKTYSIWQWLILCDAAGLDPGGCACCQSSWAIAGLIPQVEELSQKSPSVSGRLHLSSFLSFCANTDLGGWNKGACVLFPSSLEFCGLPDQAKELTWGWMGVQSSAGVRKWKGNGEGKQTQDENFCTSSYIPDVGLPQFSPIYTQGQEGRGNIETDQNPHHLLQRNLR